MRIFPALVTLDKGCDWIPAVSTVSNIVDLFIKTVVLPFTATETIQNNAYYSHLNDKSFLRCVSLSILPLLGTVSILLYLLCRNPKPKLPDNFHEAYELARYNPGILQKVDLTPANIAMIENLATRNPGLFFDYLKTDPRWCDNPTVMLAAIKADVSNFESTSIRLRNDRTFMLHVSTIHPPLFERAGPGAKKDVDSKVEAFRLIRTEREALKKIDHSLENNPEIVKAALSYDHTELQYTSLRDDRAFMLERLKENGNLMQYAGQGIRRSKQHMDAAAEAGFPEAIEWSELRNDPEYMKVFVAKYGAKYLIYSEKLRANATFILECLGAKKDKSKTAELFLVLRNHFYHNGFPKDLEFLKSDEFTLKALLANGFILKDLLDDEKNNPDFVFSACLNTPEAIVYAGDKLLKNKDFVLNEIRRGNRFVFKTAHDFHGDKELVKLAVSLDGKSLDDAVDFLKKDLEIIKLAIKNNPEAILYAHPSTLRSGEIMLPLIKEFPDIGKYLPKYKA